MKRVITFSNGITVQYGLHAKTNRRGNSTIYFRFHILQNGMRLRKYEHLISTEISCEPQKWRGTYIQGKTNDHQTQISNDRLNEMLLLVNEGLIEVKRMKSINAEIIYQEIKTSLRTKLTNKAPKGQQQEYLSRLNQQTLSSICKNYLDGKNLSDSYKSKFKDVVRLDFEFHHGERAIDTYKKNDVERFKSWMQKKNFSHNSIMTYLNKLRTLFLHAIELELVSKSPIPKKGLIKAYKGSKRVVLTEEELLKINSIPDKYLSATLEKTKYIFLLLASTGLGYGELKSVKREHFELLDGKLYLRKNRNKSDEPFEVPFSDFATEIYYQYFDWLSTTLNANLKIEPFEDLPSIEYFSRSLKIIIEMAGITKKVSTYTARHTFAVNWIRNKGCPITLMRILGHTDFKTTRIYLNFLPEDNAKKADEVYSRSILHQTKINPHEKPQLVNNGRSDGILEGKKQVNSIYHSGKVSNYCQ